MKRSFFLFVLLFVVVQSFAWTEAAANKALYDDAIHTARREIWKTLSSGKASSARIAFMDNGKIVYSEGFGMRDRENALPVEKNTQFNIGSISKIFTAAAILLLVDDGRVELDQPVTKYLPSFTAQDERYKDITVRMLLNHTSGFPGPTARMGLVRKKIPTTSVKHFPIFPRTASSIRPAKSASTAMTDSPLRKRSSRRLPK